MINRTPSSACEEFAFAPNLLRVEDDRLIRGMGRFVDDIAPPGCLFLEFVRPSERAGHIASLDCSAALAFPGVVAVYTGADVAHCADAPVNPLLDMQGSAPFELLSSAQHRAPGQAIAAIVARTRQMAIDAAEAVIYRIPPQAERPQEASFSGASFSGAWGANVDHILQSAAHVVELEIRHALLAPLALEPRATLAQMEGETLVVYASTQTPHRMRTDLGVILGRDIEHIRVIAPDVGGAFGGKASIAPEDAMVAFAALKLGLPVKWCASRGEEFIAAPRGRGGSSRARLGLDASGHFLALETEFAFPLGHWLPYSASVPARNAARILPGPYVIPDVSVVTRADATPAAAVNIYRGAGRPEAAMLLERLADQAAFQSGMDPLALRLRNLPKLRAKCRTAAGDVLDRADYRALLKAVADAGEYRTLRTAQRKRQKRGDICGIGLALYVEPCGQGWESGRVGLLRSGKIIASTGSSAQGQGRETAYAAIVAKVLGVCPGQVEVWHGDTATTPTGIGALASRSTAIGGSAIRKAAGQFLAKLRGAIALKAGCDPAHVQVRPEGLHLPGAKTVLGWKEIAQSAEAPVLPDTLLYQADARFETENEAWASGAVLAAVTIDRNTGELGIERLIWADDPGNVINPMLVEGQLVGGMAQGFGEAMMEALHFDARGELLSGSLLDYAVPRALDVPKVELHTRSVPSSANPLGAKGVGEAGAIGIPAAIINAAIDALRPYGVQHLDMPLNAEKLWRAMRQNDPNPTGSPK